MICIDKGRLIYLEKRVRSEIIFNLIFKTVHILIIAFLLGLSIYEIITWQTSGIPLIHIIIGEIAQFSIIIFLFFYFISHFITVPLAIFENGFVYKLRIRDADRKDNFLPYNEITHIQFLDYGLTMVLTTKKGHKALIKIGYGIEFYFILIKYLISKFNIEHYPDIQAIVMYMAATNKKNQLYTNNTPIKPRAQALQELIIKNNKYV